VRAAQQLATLRADHAVYSAPDPQAPQTETLARIRPITHGPTVVPVLGHRGAWLRVRLPGRPNSHTGWIQAVRTTRASTPWHVVIDRAARRATVYQRGRALRRFAVIVGAPATPTPAGEFFVEENIAEPASVPGAPFALALSARSTVYDEFDDGPGQVALHGVAHLAGALGTAASHGCIRFSTAAITWLADRLPPGVPVTIR
jgi:lipoprotein-anchoring transpeptidase ErfK/SrfK